MAIAISVVDSSGIYEALGWVDGLASSLTITGVPNRSWKSVMVRITRYDADSVGTTETVYSQQYTTSRSSNVVVPNVPVNNAGGSRISVIVSFWNTLSDMEFASLDIDVHAYAAPQITTLTVQRALSDGTPDNAGDRLKYTLAASMTPTSPNVADVRLLYREKGETPWTTVALASGVTSISYTDQVLSGVTFDAATTFELAFEIEDMLIQASALRTLQRDPSSGLIYFSPNLDALGFGCANKVPGTMKHGLVQAFSAEVLAALVTTLLGGGMLGNGVIQFRTGTVSTSSSGGTATFNPEFPSDDTIAVIVNPLTSTPQQVSITGKSKTGCLIRTGADVTNTLWVAIWLHPSLFPDPV